MDERDAHQQGALAAMRMKRTGTVRLLALVVLLAPLLLARPAMAVETGCAIDGAPPGAEIFIDDRRIGTAPLPGPLMISAGRHQLRVQRPGYTPYNEPLKIFPGRLSQVLVDMAPIAGVLRLRIDVPRVRVLLDGAYVGEAPLETEMAIGPHVVRAGREGYREVEFSLVSVAGEVIEREIKLMELPGRTLARRPMVGKDVRWYERWWVWTLGIAAAGGVATAIIVPTLQASRKPCQRLEVEFCVPVTGGATTGATGASAGALMINIAGTF